QNLLRPSTAGSRRQFVDDATVRTTTTGHSIEVTRFVEDHSCERIGSICPSREPMQDLWSPPPRRTVDEFESHVPSRPVEITCGVECQIAKRRFATGTCRERIEYLLSPNPT